MQLSNDARAVIDVPMWPTREELLSELRSILAFTPPMTISQTEDVLLDSRTGHRVPVGYLAKVLHLHKRLDTIVKMLEEKNAGS